MNWEDSFKNQSFGQAIYKHKDLPVYITSEFVFYRCVEFRNDFYGKTASTLFNGNLRLCTGRYSKLFPNQKLSYWADSPVTARAEIKHHGAKNSILTFKAYDDGTSTFPTLSEQSPLVIIDGRRCGVQDLIDKADNDIPLSKNEQQIINELLAQNPDCLIYDSRAKKGGQNYIFFESGFKKLSLHSLALRLNDESAHTENQIICAVTSDFAPCLENYGRFFLPKARVAMDDSYLQSDEYQLRKKIFEQSRERIRR